MVYNDLVKDIAAKAEVDVEVVRKVLLAMPTALLSLEDKGQVRTPLGVFRMMTRRERTVRIPTSPAEFPVTEERVVKLRSGSRLRRGTQ